MLPVHPVLPALAALLSLYLIAPFLAGVFQATAADWRGIDVATLAQAGLVSITSATLASALIGLCGIPLGYLLARMPGPGMALLGFVVQLPLALPPLASGILLLFLLGYASPLGHLTGGAFTDSFTGIVLAEAFVAAPFLIVAARSAFAAVDPALEDVAATLGHRPGSVFRRVSLALSLRGIWAGLLLTWLRAFGEFGATVMVAYHPYSLPVYTYVAFGSEGLPAMLPILLPTVLIAMLVMAISLRTRSPSRTIPVGQHADAVPLASAGPPVAHPAACPLEFSFTWHRTGFELDVAWRTDARRLCILGASGSGKSATLRLLAGLDRADHAAVRLDGHDLGGLPPHARGVAYVPQLYGLLPHLPVERQIRFGVDCDPARALHWTDRLGLGELQRRLPSELSPGQQQRVALARALSRRCRLLLLDEPFAALDAALRAQLRDELASLQYEIDMTSILVTHDPEEAMLLADELLLLEAGQVLQSGPAETLFRRPANRAAARLLGARTFAAGHAMTPQSIDVGGGIRLQVAGEALAIGPVGWAVHPGRIGLTSDDGYPAEVIEVGPVRAGQRRLLVRFGSTVLQVDTDPGFSPQTRNVLLSIDPAALQVWPRWRSPSGQVEGQGGPTQDNQAKPVWTGRP